jgi:AcrR family transcriptional regulator
MTRSRKELATQKRGRPRAFDRLEALRRAMDLFWIKGYEGASISDLTTAMGIGSPSLYAAFGSKEALFLEAAKLYDATEGSLNWRALQTAPTAREATEGVLMDTAAAFGRKGKPAGCLTVLSALNVTDANQTIRQALRGKRELCIEALEARLRRAVEVGELSRELDIRSVATFYVTVHQGMSIQSRDGASSETLMRIARAAMSAWETLTQPPDRRGNGEAKCPIDRASVPYSMAQPSRKAKNSVCSPTSTSKAILDNPVIAAPPGSIPSCRKGVRMGGKVKPER